MSPSRPQGPWKQRPHLVHALHLRYSGSFNISDLISNYFPCPSTPLLAFRSVSWKTHWPSCCSSTHQGNTCLRAFTPAVPFAWITLLLDVYIGCPLMSFSFSSDVPFWVRLSLATFYTCKSCITAFSISLPCFFSITHITNTTQILCILPMSLSPHHQNASSQKVGLYISIYTHTPIYTAVYTTYMTPKMGAGAHIRN